MRAALVAIVRPFMCGGSAAVVVNRLNSDQAVRGQYDGATNTADLACKPLFAHSADATILADREIIAARAADLVRNDGMIKNGLDILCDTVIGPGLRFRCTPDYRALGIPKEAADHFGDQVKRALRMWGQSSDHTNDAQLKLSWGSQQRLAFRTMLVNGDALAVLRYRPDHGRLGTCIQLINPDRLQTPVQFRFFDDYIRGGVQIDDLGAAVGYHILPNHPSDLRRGTWRRWTDTPQFYPRWTDNGLRLVVHAFESEKEDQNRGVSVFAQSIIIANQMKTYREAELQSAQVLSHFPAVIKSEYGQQSAFQALGGMPTNQMPSHGLDWNTWNTARSEFHKENHVTFGGTRIPHLFPGEQIDWVTQQREASAFINFTDVTSRIVAAGLGMSWEQFLGDYSKINFSSARMSQQSSWRAFQRRRDLFAEHFCLPVIERVVAEAIAVGLIDWNPAWPDFEVFASDWLRGRFIGPAKPQADPQKEMEMYRQQLDMGLISREDIAFELGVDFEEVQDRLALETQRLHGVAPESAPPQPDQAADPALLETPNETSETGAGDQPPPSTDPPPGL